MAAHKINSRQNTPVKKDQANIRRLEKLKEDQINIISTQSVHLKFQEKKLQENNDKMKFE